MATLISWTDETWNPTTGCHKVSEGCRFCYAEALSLRFGRSAKPWTLPNAEENFLTHEDRIRKPFAWKKPSRVFVNSMSDLFHERMPRDFLRRVWDVMVATPQHTYQILTKRPERAATWEGPWAENIWMGTSIESARHLDRLDAIRSTGAATRFVSAEPLLGPFGPDINLSGIHWMIVGGESGSHMNNNPERWMDHAWAREIRDASVSAGTAFFFKQSSGLRTEMGTALREEDGSEWEWHQYPGHMDPPRLVKSAA